MGLTNESKFLHLIAKCYNTRSLNRTKSTAELRSFGTFIIHIIENWLFFTIDQNRVYTYNTCQSCVFLIVNNGVPRVKTGHTIFDS